jgi:hypothetical protein
MHRQDTGISIVARRFLSAFPAQIDQQVRNDRGLIHAKLARHAPS